MRTGRLSAKNCQKAGKAQIKRAGAAVVHTRQPQPFDRLRDAFAYLASSAGAAAASVAAAASSEAAAEASTAAAVSSATGVASSAGFSPPQAARASEPAATAANRAIFFIGNPLVLTLARRGRARGGLPAKSPLVDSENNMNADSGPYAASFSTHSGKKQGGRSDQPGAVAAASLIDCSKFLRRSGRICGKAAAAQKADGRNGRTSGPSNRS